MRRRRTDKRALRVAQSAGALVIGQLSLLDDKRRSRTDKRALRALITKKAA